MPETNSFRQHIPAFARDGREPPEPVYPFETTEELLALEVVRRYISPTHSHFAMSGRHLMEVCEDGYSWWVVGFIEKPELVNLPPWKGWRFLARLEDGSEVTIEPDDPNPVVASCGGQLTRRDGSLAVDVLLERRMAKQKRDSELLDRGICDKHETPFRVVEQPEKAGKKRLIRVESYCDACGGLRMTHWRKA